MLLRNELNFLLALGFGLVASKSTRTLPSIDDRRFIQECVQTHNFVRQFVRPTAANMLYMSWDEALAKNAKAWANQCNFAHNPNLQNEYYCHPVFKYVGENIWLNKLHRYTAVSPIYKWRDEGKDYNITTVHCYKVCGRYTQVIWANTYKVGCAITNCPESGGDRIALFVCNYGPQGNHLDLKPYIEGEPCSMCRKGDTCENNLCRNAIRDKLVEYPNWKPKWTKLQSNPNAHAQHSNLTGEAQNSNLSAEAQHPSVNAEAQNSNLSTGEQHPGVNAETQHSNLSAEAQNFSVNAEPQHSNLSAEAQNFSVNAETQHSNLSTEVQNSSVNAEAQNSNISTEAQHPSVNTETQNSNLSAEAQHPSVNAETQHSNLSAEAQNSSVNAETQQSNLSAEAQHPSVNAETQHSNLSAEAQNSSVNAEAQHLNLSAEAQNSTVNAEAQHSNLIVEAQNSSVNAEAQHSNLSAEAEHLKPKGEAPQWAACNLLCLVYIHLGMF